MDDNVFETLAEHLAGLVENILCDPTYDDGSPY